MILRAGVDKALRCSPFQSWYAWAGRHRLSVLAYHGVNDARSFETHLDYLGAEYHPVSYPAVAAALDGQLELPDRALLITFDDADRTILDSAMPALASRDIPAVAFVTAGLLGTDRPFWWEEAMCLAAEAGKHSPGAPTGRALVRSLRDLPDAERLAAMDELRLSVSTAVPARPQLRPDELHVLESSGVVIGNHTLSHPSLPHCDMEKVQEEICRAHEQLSTVLGHKPDSFAYPYGRWDERSIRVLSELGYRTAFVFDHAPSVWPPKERYLISRLRVDDSTTLDRLALILSGLHPALHRASRREKAWSGRNTGGSRE